MLLHRITLPFINALFITLLLLYLMFLLIDIEDAELLPVKTIGPMTWIQVPEEEPVKTIVIKPTLPPAPAQAPSIEKTIPELDAEFDTKGLTAALFTPIKTGNLANIENHQLIRLFGQPGEYPMRAIQRGIEGYVIVGFSVDHAGLVFDAFVIESAPEGVFEGSALKAIKKFKYKAKMSDGKAVASTGQQYLFSYKLDND